MKFVSEFCAKSDNTDTHLSSLITFIVRENLQVPSAYPNTQLYTYSEFSSQRDDWSKEEKAGTETYDYKLQGQT